MSLYDGVELAFVTGKGGVGKSTVALAAALAAARDGPRGGLCEVAGQARARGLCGGGAPPPGGELQLDDGLWSTTIDPVMALEEWAGRQIGSRGARGGPSGPPPLARLLHPGPRGR